MAFHQRRSFRIGALVAVMWSLGGIVVVWHGVQQYVNVGRGPLCTSSSQSIHARGVGKSLATRQSRSSSDEDIQTAFRSNCGTFLAVGLTACAAFMVTSPAANAAAPDDITTSKPTNSTENFRSLGASKADATQSVGKSKPAVLGLGTSRMPWEMGKNPLTALNPGQNRMPWENPSDILNLNRNNPVAALSGANRMPWEKGPVEKVLDPLIGANRLPWERSPVEKVLDPLTGANRFPWEKGLVEQVLDPLTGANRLPWERSPVEKVLDPLTGANRLPWERSPVERVLDPLTGADKRPWEKTPAEQAGDTANETLVPFAAVGAGIAAIHSSNVSRRTGTGGKDEDSK